ncbi:tetratricopeptide repeat protein, partial [Treponema endosymbiont of Eucomonympha sp.]|uniref:tetratricopeptide repeat protein n=1 Tax=Treponema endosymbiont of Eucomonympha sp. TaxID=1580831 RepID=UPI001396CF0E
MLSGDVDDKSAQAIGKFVGAQAVITGQFIAAGDAYRFRAQSVHVESAVRKTSTRLDVQNTAKLRRLLAALRNSKTVSRAADYGAAENAAPTTAGAFLDKGLLFAGRGEFDTAIAFFTDAIKLDPNYASAYNNRGTAYDVKGAYDRARADLPQAIKHAPAL